MREDAVSNRRLVDILHEVTGELSATEIYRLLAIRVARALEISHCSVVLARPGDSVGTVAAAAEDATIEELEIALDGYPEIGTALESERPVLVTDARDPPALRRHARRARHAKASRSTSAPSRRSRSRSIGGAPGVLFLRTVRDERALTTEDVEFADIVIRAAVAAIRRAQALETTRADNRRLEALATTDPLTRVLNRRALLDRLTAEVDRARRFGSSLTLLLLDVDHFKAINDTAGHLAGDSVLRQLGALLEEAVRKVDVVARYGGEEFVAILPETASEGGVVFAERLRERIAAQSFDIGSDRPVHLTVSIGIATFPSPRVATTEDFFARADEALYRAKVRRPQPSAHLTNRCPTCGTLYADDARFCTRDGTRLLGGTPAASAPAQPAQVATPGRSTAALTRNDGAPPVSHQNLVGQTLQGHYEIVKKVGEGGMSFVYLATDIATRERYAIKVLSAALSKDANAMARLRREASWACASPIRTSVTSFGSVRRRTVWSTS